MDVEIEERKTMTHRGQRVAFGGRTLVKGRRGSPVPHLPLEDGCREPSTTPSWVEVATTHRRRDL